MKGAYQYWLRLIARNDAATRDRVRVEQQRLMRVR